MKMIGKGQKKPYINEVQMEKVRAEIKKHILIIPALEDKVLLDGRGIWRGGLMKKKQGFILIMLIMFSLPACGSTDVAAQDSRMAKVAYEYTDEAGELPTQQQTVIDGFLLIPVPENKTEFYLVDEEVKEETL